MAEPDARPGDVSGRPPAVEGDPPGPLCYLVALQLGHRDAYPELEATLGAFPVARRVLEGLWAVVTELEAAELRDRLWSLIDPDDGIFVVRSGREAAWQDVLCENQWLKEHL